MKYLDISLCCVDFDIYLKPIYSIWKLENYFEGLNLAKLHRAGRRWDDLSFPEKNVKYLKVVQFLYRLQHFNSFVGNNRVSFDVLQ